MSTLAKIFVVVNLFLALAYVGVMSALLGQSDNFKVKWQNAVDRLATETSVLTARITRSENEKNDAIRAQSTTVERLAQVQEQWENARRENQNLVTRQKELEVRLVSLDSSYGQISAKIEQVSEENGRLQAEIRTREKERDEARDAQRQAEEMFMAGVGELEIAEDRLRELGQQVENTSKSLAEQKLINQYQARNPGSISTPVAPPAIDGRVVAVSAEVPIVMLSVGADDHVEAGTVFTVYRGDTYVAKVRVQDVFKDSSSAYIVPEYQKMAPREGDNVSTRIY